MINEWGKEKKYKNCSWFSGLWNQVDGGTINKDSKYLGKDHKFGILHCDE